MVLPRRQLLTRLMSLPLLGALGTLASKTTALPDVKPRQSTTLIAYFTRSGNTRVVAEQLARKLNANMFVIAPATPYPADYEANVEQARRERDAGYQPPLKQRVPGFSGYERVFIGFPIWGMTAPPVIRSFLAQHDLTDKTLVPFITHGKYGLGDSVTVLKQLAPRATILDAYSQECDQERDTMNQVNSWLSRLSADSNQHELTHAKS
ncbi:flavodoxin [Gilvimarinus sp. SDUM040013]|uniref:Flavodoxin n=1 Tax=Gilvimarinus gilvus TaxID=3058038 RepID=A0ABU4RYL2_9GAMM|nr:flavodoxin [Gilvimarinus sp. SDUM040013]MDO3385624.1 flavodoxin [Gilvimarinus sp. SDUM040013]MDX6849958.1 flavodoxin [Gilvimarinus sp. SDUM040013]